ncbi:MAG: ABC transporter permease [Thermonemataceae bacterium]|nr:ABC transporter permease [Thermonemataceae bacterium]
MIQNEQDWTEEISPKNKWFDIRLNEIWRYRDLVGLFVYRDFVAVYKQTILGPLWHIIQPLFTTFVFSVVFGSIAKISTDGVPHFLFYLCSVTIWNYFANSINSTSNVFVSNASVFGKVYFPRLTVPVANVISGFMAFSIQFGLFLIAYLIYLFTQDITFAPNWWILAVPIFAFNMALLGLGLGIIVSSLTTKYRDLSYAVGFGVQLLMYVSGVIHPLSYISEEKRMFILLNPIFTVIEGFRYAFFGKGVFEPSMLLYSLGISSVIFLVGVALFHKVEKTFMDTV